MKIDALDKKILSCLASNSRQSLKQIGTQVKLSKSSVKYRIENLEKAGIIKYYETIINGKKTNYINFRLMIKLSNVSPSKSKEIIQSMKKIDQIVWLARTQGIADLIVTCLCSSVKEFAECVAKMEKEIGKHIVRKEISLAHEIYYFTPNFLFEKRTPFVKASFPAEKDSLRDFDKAFLEIISKNAKESLVDIADKLNCSTKRVMRCKKKLEKDKIILKYSIEIDYSKVGLEMYHIFWKFSNYDEKRLGKFVEHLLQTKEIIYLTRSLSTTSIESDFLVPDQRSLFHIIEKIKQEFPDIIADIEFFMIHDVIKT